MRAVAVTLVLLFHLGVPGFGGGFVGVDVFFVLSGFLITSLLLAEMQKADRISLSGSGCGGPGGCCRPRVLLLVVAAVAALGSTFTEKASLRGDLLSTAAYAANWHFISTSSYFSSTGFPSPLQHTWSLAIEEQFYVAWPLVLAAIGALAATWGRRRSLVAAVGGIAAVASAAALLLLWSPGHVERAYMGTDTRIFEPLLGALGAVAVTTGRGRAFLARRATAVTTAGVVLLAAGVGLVASDERVYPYGGALLVALASLLLIAPLWVAARRPRPRARCRSGRSPGSG